MAPKVAITAAVATKTTCAMAPKVAITAAVATKGVKRLAATQQQPATKPAAPQAKAQKKCQMLQAVEEVIENAEGLPESCRQMLLSTFPISVRVPADDRHAFHVLAMNQVDDIMKQKSARMQHDIDMENAATARADATKADLESKVVLAQNRLASLVQAAEQKQTAFTESSKLLVDKEDALISAQTIEHEASASVEVAKSEKEAYEAAFENHFKPLSNSDLDATEAMRHFSVMQPFIAKLSLDDSLVTTIPGTLMKPHSARGSFDQMVMAELEGSLSKHIASLGLIVEAAVPAAAEHTATVKRAQQDRDVSIDQKEAAANDVTEAEQNMKEAHAELTHAKEMGHAFMPEYSKATALRDEKVNALEEFMTWNVGCFNVLRNKDANNVQPTASAEPKAQVTSATSLNLGKEVGVEVEVRVQVEFGGA